MSKEDMSKPWLPLSGLAEDGYTKEDRATATCFCGVVQIEFPTEEPGFVDSFVCNCSDCHKITASQYATNFMVKDSYMKYIRGKENLKMFGPQSKTIATGNTMSNHFCSTCGALMFRVSSGFPGISIMRVGSIDDFHLQETKIRPRIEQFIKYRLSWLPGVEKTMKFDGHAYDNGVPPKE